LDRLHQFGVLLKARFLKRKFNFSFFLIFSFFQLTIGIMGLFIFLDPQQMKQSYLRLLTYSLPLSQVYDMVWIINKSTEYWIDKTEGGMA
jgi:hypothetical protein